MGNPHKWKNLLVFSCSSHQKQLQGAQLCNWTLARPLLVDKGHFPLNHHPAFLAAQTLIFVFQLIQQKSCMTYSRGLFHASRFWRLFPLCPLKYIPQRGSINVWSTLSSNLSCCVLPESPPQPDCSHASQALSTGRWQSSLYSLQPNYCKIRRDSQLLLTQNWGW